MTVPVHGLSAMDAAEFRDNTEREAAHLRLLESEAIYILREVAAEFERPVLLFSGGKDSIVLLCLAELAFAPGRIPFAVMHVDTGHNFPEVIDYRDRRMAELGVPLIVASVQDAIDRGRVVEERGPRASRNRLQTTVLLDAIAEHRFDAALGGARRDEEKARAKERVFSARDEFGQWNPRAQRPELWNLYNGMQHRGEHMRVFPLSNWTELDIWHYIASSGLEIPSIYFAHERDVFERDGMLMSTGEYIELLPNEQPRKAVVRYRTVGDMTCTAAVQSDAATLFEVIREIASARVTERGSSRADDRTSEAAMEDRKREGYFEVDLLRFATAGSVDDGKSTLIGRLLYDSKQVFEDVMDGLRRSTAATNFEDEVNLALLTDGLRAEREQGITIDVAYRYFATPVRKFIIADSPGHVQYTRNMITGASTADLTLILVDARHGVVEQTRRHAAIAALLGIRHVVLCVNKMDVVDFDQTRFDQIVREFEFVQETVGLEQVTAIPISALTGDNVVTASEAMSWFEGAPLLEFLETVPIPHPAAAGPFRFPVQYVIRPQTKDLHDYRGYAGTILGGHVKAGDPVVVLPSGLKTTVEAVDFAGEPLESGELFQAATIRLADDIDAGRGSMIADAASPPSVTREIVADLCWMNAETALKPRQQFLLKTSTQRVKAMVTALVDRLDIESLERVGEPEELALNGLARVVIKTADPVMVDPYRRDRWTGSFVLIDPATFSTVAAGMVRVTDATRDEAPVTEDAYA